MIATKELPLGIIPCDSCQEKMRLVCPFECCYEGTTSTYLIVFHYDQLESFKRFCHKEGAVYCGHMMIPNVGGWKEDYCCVYQHSHALEMEILT